MIAIEAHKDHQGTWHMRVTRVADGREILRSGADTPREAAIWLVRKINKIAAEVEDQIVELGFLTEAECEAAIAGDEGPPTVEPSP